MKIYFDIETGSLPVDQVIAMMPEFEAPGNLKDPEKIKAAIEEKKKDFIERAALSPTTGQILAVGYSDTEGQRIEFQDDANEKELISNFFELFSHGETLIGFNCHSFDVPFMIRRGWSLGLSVPTKLLNRYMPDNVIDLMKIWSCGNWDQKISLSNLAKFFGLGEKKGAGEDFAKIYYEDRPKAIEYLNHDILLTKLIGQRMGI